MADSPAPVAGPSNSGPAQTDANPLRTFVLKYLQSHGFDKAYESFREADGGADGDADGDNVLANVTTGTANGGPGGGRRGSTSGVGREAIFRAPGPVPIESTLKRNIPQAMAVSASTMSSERITPEFEAQAKYIIEQLQKRAEAAQEKERDDGDGEDVVAGAGGSQESLLDPSDRVEGYKRYRRWVDDGLELWNAELEGLSFPLFAHTFLDLLHYGFARTARTFFDTHRTHHEPLHPQEVSSLASIASRNQIARNPYCQRLISEKYTVALSRNSHDLLLQWLSGAGIDEEWESGMRTSAGRAKEAVKAIVFARITLTVSNQHMPLDKITLASSSGLVSGLLPPSRTFQTFNSAITLKLGPPPMTEKLRNQVVQTIRDDEADANGDATADRMENSADPARGSSAVPNGHANGNANGDVDMASPGAGGSRGMSQSREPGRSPSVDPNQKKLGAEGLAELDDRESDLVSPGEGETLPPIPPLFRVTDLKREVEAIRDKRKMIRLGPGADEGKLGPSVVLPSVVAFTVFDGGEGVTSVEFSGDSSMMAVGSPESCIRVWSLKGEKLKAKSVDPRMGDLTEDDGLPLRKLIGHSGPVYSLSFDPISGSAGPPSALLSSSQDGTVRLWSMDTYTNLVAYRGHGRDPVWDVEWGPMGVYFATASRDRTARLWSSDRVTPLRMYTGHLSDVNCVKFHPNSLYLATGSNDNSCRLWDVQRGACIRLFLGHTDGVTCTAISPDGRTLASAGLDSSIWLWDLGSSRPIKKMTAHRGPIYSLSWSAESSVLVSGGADCTVRCWDVKSAGGEHRRGSLGLRGAAGENGRGGMAGDGSAIALAGMERGALPMGPGEVQWDEMNATSDLLATFHTKRTPIIKTHYTPRNLCMVAGAFVPPGSGI